MVSAATGGRLPSVEEMIGQLRGEGPPGLAGKGVREYLAEEAKAIEREWRRQTALASQARRA
jgi:hypothetical protein